MNFTVLLRILNLELGYFFLRLEDNKIFSTSIVPFNKKNECIPFVNCFEIGTYVWSNKFHIFSLFTNDFRSNCTQFTPSATYRYFKLQKISRIFSLFEYSAGCSLFYSDQPNLPEFIQMKSRTMIKHIHITILSRKCIWNLQIRNLKWWQQSFSNLS